jgi:predicted transposase YbfD/YdcC
MNTNDHPGVPSLIACLQGVPDPRVNRTREHKLIDILVIGLCSMLTVGENFTDMEDFGLARHEWLKRFLELPCGIPSHDTFNRVFSAIDPDCFLDCFIRWVQGICTSLQGEVVAVDGKALRSALNDGASLPYIVSAWACESGLALGQVKVDDKSNEITAVPELLRVLELKGCIVTLDAMGCQKTIAAQIVDAGADYLLALKGNHPAVHEEFKSFFDSLAPEGAEATGAGLMDYYQSTEKGHGRVEIRRYWHSTDIAWFADKKLWCGLRSAGMVESVRIIKGERSVERRYYLSSLELNAQKFANAVRAHWGIENQLHWSLDVTFGEDQNRARTGYANQNLALLRRLCLNLVKRKRDPKLSMRRQRKIAALKEDYLQQLLGMENLDA